MHTSDIASLTVTLNVMGTEAQVFTFNNLPVGCEDS